MKNNKIILYSIIVIVVLLVAFNLSKITGQTTKELPAILAQKMDANTVRLTIYPVPGKCVDRTIALYRERTLEVEGTSRPDSINKQIEIKTGSYKMCDKPVNFEYDMSGDYKGNFYFEGTAIYKNKDGKTIEEVIKSNKFVM